MAPYTIKVDSVFYDFYLPLTIFQACLSKKIYLPRFCYHYSLKIAGNCRMCLVEEKSSLKPLASCAVTIINGHTLYTNTEAVKRAREGVLEYLLINHPLDCPICDQGGECDLQDQTMVFGADRGRFYEIKRSSANKNLGFLIKTFLNRCIQCARCTRFLNEIAGTDDLQLLGRGLKTEISNYIPLFIKSEISGNIIDLCPVGALTSKPYSFKARPWELFSVYTYDIIDGFGANIQLDFRGLELLRVLPKTNRFLNEEWISDRTRFSYDSFNIQRLTNSFFLNNNNFKKLNWYESLLFFKNILFLKKKLSFNFNFGDFLDFETCLASKNLFQINSLKSLNNFDYIKNKDSRIYFGLTQLDFLDLNLNDIELYSYILINSNLRFESPILNLKLRSIFSNHENKVFILGFISNFNFDFKHISNIFSNFFFNFLIQKKTNIILSSISFISFKNFNFVSKNLALLTQNDLNLFFNKNLLNFNYLTFNIGQPENYLFYLFSYLNVNILHHIEDEFLNIFNSFYSILLPASFYFEKDVTYLNNTFNFFNLLTHFSIKIPNTKPEWKILYAINEIFTGNQISSLNKNLVFFLTNLNFRVLDFFNLFYFENFFDKLKRSSIINNFYFSNIVTRLSSIMNLCSNRLSLINDYIYSVLS